MKSIYFREYEQRRKHQLRKYYLANATHYLQCAWANLKSFFSTFF